MGATPTFGHVGTARPGDLFASRLDLSLRGQHRPPRAGVCATSAHGAESLILADQYEDDEIHDDYFWYAGYGSRDGQTGRQVAHQDLNHRNRALTRSQETGRPIRVFRRIDAAPAAWQFRYEGLFYIVNLEYITGKSGFGVYRFRLEPWRAKTN
ncbi:YDG/SRA domain-containing protein [Hymenobacter baengnokdamensis]|uniref:YDG/SRA domain-containing protein n=1 Tax=Hymenobacter baengnokdamensis TaxID=2615203 RepID=UPI001245BB4B|nr:YDG/SRA domain-containing protein [Hymenobacter baengnokdamensis]